MKKLILSIFFLVLLAAGCGKNQATNNSLAQPATSYAPHSTEVVGAAPPKAPLIEPISGALSRVTKKPFGIYITPATSPVQPERFKGFHTGTDFETTADEQTAEVPVFAACDGKLILRRFATGYGGVMVQSCTLDNNPVTIIYGHIRLTSVTAKVGATLKAGQTLAVLGKGYSYETDGERKHLHFGIHKGAAVEIAGYVQNKSELDGWLDAMNYFK